MTHDPTNDPDVIDARLDEVTGRFTTEEKPTNKDDDGLWAFAPMTGFGTTMLFGIAPNYLVMMFAGHAASQPVLAGTGAAVGVATSFGIAMLGKTHKIFSNKEVVSTTVTAAVTAGAIVYGLTQGWMAPPRQSQEFINLDRFDWKSAPIEERMTHWCVTDINGNQNPEWDGKNLDCGPRPDPAPLYK